MKVYHQSVFDKWEIEDKSVQAICTSPPYYSLRRYPIPDIIIGGDKDCKHEWELFNRIANTNTPKCTMNSKIVVPKTESNSIQQGFCIHCNAWQGQYGLEPTFQLYLEHSILWLKEAWRVLRDDGVLFLNIADSYAGSNQGRGTKVMSKKQSSNTGTQWMCGESIRRGVDEGVSSKSLLLIPDRLWILMSDAGWIIRNRLIWFKPNAMPESVTDRFSKKYEDIIFATKQQTYYFDLDAVKIPSITYETDKRCSALERARMKGYKTKIQYNGKSSKTSEFLASTPYCNPGDVWSIPTQPSPEKHFAMWPEALVKRMILCSTKAGDAVLDPFCGSGTTLMVADKLNRIGIGIDLGYEDIQKRRLTEIQKELL